MKFFLIILVVFLLLIGVGLLAKSIYCIYLYLTNPKDGISYEFIQASALFLLYALPFWIMASCSAIPIKEDIPLVIYYTILTITLLILLVLAIFILL